MIKKEIRNRLILFGIIIAVLILTGIAIFSQPKNIGSDQRDIYEYDESLANIDYGSQFVNLTINDFTFTVDSFSDGAIYDTAWMTTEYDTVMTLGDFSGCSIWVNGIEAHPNSTISFRVDKLSKDNFIDVKFASNSTSYERTIQIRTLNSAFPDYQVYNNTDQTEDFCFSIPDQNFIAKMNRDGNILFYRLGSGASNFVQHNIDGKIRYSYMETTGKSLALCSEYKAYKGVVLNECYNVIDIVENVITTGDDKEISGLCKKGFEFIDDFHYLVATLYPDYCVPISSGSYRVAVTRIQEIAQGNIVWSKDIYDPDMNEYIDSPDTISDGIKEASVSIPETKESMYDVPAYVDMMELSNLIKSESGNYSFCLFKKAGIICRIDNNGNISGVSMIPDGYELRNMHITSDNNVLLMLSSLKTNETYIVEHHLNNSYIALINADFIGYSSGDGSFDISQFGNILVCWGKNTAPAVKFTEFGENRRDVYFELIAFENSGMVIDSVSYAIKGVEVI